MALGNAVGSLATLLFLDAPSGSLAFSVDGVEGKPGSRFTGFTEFPAGCHFLSFHAAESMATPFPCMLFWVQAGDNGGKVLLLFRWNAGEETFVRQTDFDERAISEQLVSCSPGLMPYGPFMQHEPNSLHTWNALTSFVTKALLQRLGSLILPSAQDTAVGCLFESLVGRLTKIPNVKAFAKAQSLDPAKISRLAMDHSAILEAVLNEFGDDSEGLLGELQIAFVIFRWAGDWEAFDHWLSVVRLFCSSEQITAHMPNLFKQFLTALQAQLLVISPDRDAELFEALTIDPLLPKLLSQLIGNCKAISELAEAAECFSKAMDVFGWTLLDCDADADDDAPTIVE